MRRSAQNGGGRARLGEILLGAGKATGEQVAGALAEQASSGERLGRSLVRMGCLSEDDLLTALADQLGLERVRLAGVKIPKEALRLLPAEFARQHRVVPLERVDGTLRVATADPASPRVIEDLRLLTGLEVTEALATDREIRDKLAECYEASVERILEDLEPTSGEAKADTLHDIEVLANEPTVINLVNLIISAALKDRASDIHLVPFEKALELRYRIDGLLQVRPPPPRHLHAAVVSRIKIMANMNIAERFIPQDGHLQIQHRGLRVDVRVGTMPTIYGESVVLRLLVKGAKVPTPVELGLDAARAEALSRIVEKPHGIVLATGPTGSGKTTTLYSVLSGIYSPSKKILTIEDPVEYELPGVGQIPVRPARGFTFATGLRAILRQDPDIIMVGEIRDAETAEIAIRAALTGHLVFSTLHTNDAPGAVTRLVDMGIEPFLIASSLEAVLAQRLVRRICTACRQEVDLSSDLRGKLAALGVDPGPGPFFAGAGCIECRDTGYSGRTGLFELLVVSPAIKDLVLARRPATELKLEAQKTMATIRVDGLGKVSRGETTVDEILRVTMSDVS